jgi:cell division protein FtsL
MAGNRHPYTHGSTAALLIDEFPEPQKRQQRQRPIEKPVVKTNASKAVKPRARRKGVFSTLFVIVCCFGIFSFIIARYSIICSTGSQIEELKSGIKTMQAEANDYQAQISEKMDMSYIQNTAKDKLNMGFPSDQQIVYVDLENENADAVVQNDENQVSKGDDKNINVLSEIINALE